jgi:FlaG/FlaF family flagellin (archaellin)
VIFIAEGKKRRGLYQDCRAVSEVYGQLLMISIVVLAFSGIALTVFSEGGAVKPKHTPHIDLQENFNRSTNTVQIFHSGGEAIDLSAIKIIFSVNGDKKGEFVSPFTVKNPDGTASSDSVFTLGDCIEINTASMDIKTGDDVEMFFIDMPSRQVIQKAVLQRGSWKLPDWITPYPYGSVYSNSSGWLPTELVGTYNDGFTNDSVPQRPDSMYQEFQFGIDADEMGISDPLTRVQLKIIYKSPDCSPDEISLLIYNGSDWTTDPTNMTMVEYHTFEECAAANKVYDINLAPCYVNTTDKLEKLKVKILGSGNAASSKFYSVDYIGVHVEF